VSQAIEVRFKCRSCAKVTTATYVPKRVIASGTSPPAERYFRCTSCETWNGVVMDDVPSDG